MQVKALLDAGWRRRWWIFVPAVVGLAVSIFLAGSLPKLYRASTTILVMRQTIPEEIVRTTVTSRVEERISSLKVQVKSRRYLEQVINELGLVRPGASDGELEKACANLSLKVDIDWDKRDLSWFNIKADDASAKRAADIANRLAELFIEQNSALRAAQAKGTVETVEGWLAKTEKELKERDAELARYKAQYLYELPDQQSPTLQLLNATQSRIQQLTGDINMRSERLATARAEFKSRQLAAGGVDVPTLTDDPEARAFAQLQRELQDLLAIYTEENPLVKRKRDQIAQFALNHPAPNPPPGRDRPAAEQKSPEMAHLEGEIRSLESDRQREQRSLDVLQRRIENMPLRQQKLAEITRDYETLKRQYDTQLAQKEQAERSQDLEAAKKGEQFQIQDRARPPVAPISPNVPMVIVFGLLGGLGLGVGLAALLEFSNHSVRSEEEFEQRYPELPVLGSIPNLDIDVRPSGGFLARYGRSKTVASVIIVGVALAFGGAVAGGLFV
jgi:polysaccharide chain length determinant protein (PEP-CTERM system associated)